MHRQLALDLNIEPCKRRELSTIETTYLTTLHPLGILVQIEFGIFSETILSELQYSPWYIALLGHDDCLVFVLF